ncbi:hypothetical protein ACHAXA_008199 [Cyclostephanos tholiformis]|uniref:Uncharacterized protein n=1 Tax=Cyclostephanos tholiformis TaxID=382380 RepID=A0ABD3SCR0_9STRA
MNVDKTTTKHRSESARIREDRPDDSRPSSKRKHEYDESIDDPRRRHPFDTNALDHCETPRAAYEHLRDFLDVLGRSMMVASTYGMSLWDPYYCDGGSKRILRDIGFDNVIHENADFYDVIKKEESIPPHDVLVTNPPYSEDHIYRLLEFVVGTEIANQRPVCLLLPNWVSRRPDYETRFAIPVARGKCELFYLSPLTPYTYIMPPFVHREDRPEHVGSSGETTPYLSSWYIVVPSSLCRGNSFLEMMDAVARKRKPKAWVVARTVRGLKWKMKKVRQHVNANGA